MFHLERLLCRNVISLTKNNNLVSSCNRIYPRFIYTPAKLGIDRYIQDRQQMTTQMQDKLENYRQRMALVCSPTSTEYVFTSDMKTMVYIAETDDDLELLKLMMEKYNRTDSQVRFSSFVIGPQIMRLYYYLSKPLEAMAALEDEKTSALFDQISSYNILLDLLYKHQLYDDVCRIYHKLVEKQFSGNVYSRESTLLYLAACYKLNTPEIFEDAKNVWLELCRRTSNPWYRIKNLFVMLALNQNDTNVALEVVSDMQIMNETVSIKLIALAQAGRLDDAMYELRSNLLKDSSDLSTISVSKDTFEKLELFFRNSETFYKEFKNHEEQYKLHNLIRNETLEELLTAEVDISEMDLRENRFLGQGINKRRSHR